MRKIIATLIVATLSSVFLATAARAAPTQVDVRIEGREKTLFEGPVLVESDGVRASSDTQARSCDGIDPLDPQNVTPQPTPTAAAADALGLIGATFDGQWYPGFDDYFITRWGPDSQSPGESAYWGVLVNDTLTAVGGCQYQLDGGDEVLWVYDAFKGRPNLALFPAAAEYASGPRPLTATVALDKPITVEVVAFEDDAEDEPPAAPGRAGSSPFEGAVIAPVATTAEGFERVEPDSSATVETGPEGKATLTFGEAGWRRIKATVVEGAAEGAIRSNRLDVCVTGGVPTKALEGATNCDELPAADRVRVAPRLVEKASPPTDGGGDAGGGTEGGGTGTASGGNGTAGGGGSGGGTGPNQGAPPAGGSPRPGTLKVSVPKVDRRRLGEGKVGLSWKVTDAGPGVREWTVSSRTLGRKAARWVIRARGGAGTTATLRLPTGHAYRLRFAITDARGQTSTIALGTVKVPKAGRRRRR
ncbi:MAG TPA: hypothetical protein VHA80_14015 [Solirubrobacterales bacterium]|nr:hypothetical protein [Solirubrobacterales bacterium]